MNVCYSIAHGLLFIGAAAVLTVTAVADNQPRITGAEPATQTSASAGAPQSAGAEQSARPRITGAEPATQTSASAGELVGTPQSVTGQTGTQQGARAQTHAPEQTDSPRAASTVPEDGDSGESLNSALSFFSIFNEPAAAPAAASAEPASAARQPLPARPPADNTPKTLPQAYGSAAGRAEENALWPTEIQDWGPFYWTLAPQDNAVGMERAFAAGPLWEQRTSPVRHDTFLRPLWTEYDHHAEGRYDLHILPPAFTTRQTPLSYDWNIFLFINYGRLGALDEKPLQTFMVFPIFFWHNDAVRPDKSFWGVFPIYGEIVHFFSFQRWHWVLFPLYTRIESWYDVTRTGVPYPFIQVFSNEAETARGLYLWPLYGHSELDGVYERMFWMWPLVYREIDQLHRPTPRVRQGFLPFYAFEDSEHVEDVSVLMLWGWRTDSQKQYHETRYLWPLWIQGRSPERTVNRWAPFYTHSKTPRIEKWWYMWPFVQHRKVPEQGVLMERSQFFYFLYWHETQTSIEHPQLPKAQMRFVWPFYASYDNGAGITQTQVLSIFEVFFPHNRAMRDTYSPLFSIYRQEADANTGLKRWSLLWNLVGSLETTRQGVAKDAFHIWPLYQSDSEQDAGARSDSWSILFGLLGWKSTELAATAVDTSPQRTAEAAASADNAPPAPVAASHTPPTATNADSTPSAPPSATADPSTRPPAERKSTLTLFWFDIDV